MSVGGAPAASEDSPGWNWRTQGNQKRGVYIDGQGWMIEDAQGNLSAHPHPAGTPKKEGMVSVGGGKWVPKDTASFHAGGIVTGRRGADVPIVARSGEGVFTEAQMAAMGTTMSDATIQRLAEALGAVIAANPPQITTSAISRGLHESRRR